MTNIDNKRLFFGLEVAAPWPDSWPRGRLLGEGGRHMTLAFLGNVPWGPLESTLSHSPIPEFSLGPTGYFDDCLFLPSRRPNVVAWHAAWFDAAPLLDYQSALSDWLRLQGYSLDDRPFLPHVTLARWPFDRRAWEQLPFKRPVVGRAIHLYESLGNLQYEPRWTHSLLPPFEEISHTADIAFIVRGTSLKQVLHSAQTALAFEHPQLLDYWVDEDPQSHDDIIALLNRLIARADAEVGVPFKAVSYHGELEQKSGHLQWEMIVDV